MNKQNKEWKESVLTLEKYLKTMTKGELIKYCLGIYAGICIGRIK